MLSRDICKILGYYLLGLSIALVFPFFLAVYYQFLADPATHPQPHSTGSFLLTIVICLVLSAACYRYGRTAFGHLYRREGIVVVVLIWFLTPAIGAIPFYVSGTLENPLQAFFETTSGFTTTGSTVMQAKQYDEVSGKEIPIRRTFCGANETVYTFYGTIAPVRDDSGEVLYEGIEAVSRALLFWRSLTQWLGGMGIVVLFVAILPLLGVGGKVLFQTEVSGPVKESLTPRITETALQLWKIYVSLTILEIVLLMFTNSEMPFFDALTIAFSTLATGGFSIKNTSIGAYNNPYTDWIVILFMLLGATNFSLYYFLLKGKFYKLYEPEWILFIILVILSCGFVFIFLNGQEKILLNGEDEGVFGALDALRYGSFQLVSAMTSTGFATADYEHWPYSIQVLMLVMMFVGGMSGSTAGGMKVIRHYMLFRIIQYRVESLFCPQAVRRFCVGAREVDQGVSHMVLCFFTVVVSIATFSTFIFTIDGVDPETALSSTACFMNNIGLAFRMNGVKESCAFLSNFSLIWSSLLMIFGRLEYFAILALMVPAFWRQI